MLPTSRSFIFLSISAALISLPLAAEVQVTPSANPLAQIDQCRINEPGSATSSSQPINVEADKLEVVSGQRANYSGDVTVIQGNKIIKAENVTFNQIENSISAEGDVSYSDGEFKTTSKRATNNLNSDEIVLEDTQYKFLCEPGRGEAAYISKTGKAMYKIEDGSITSCPEGDNAWRLTASSISVDQEEEAATFFNPRLEVLDVPIFYLPYLTVPIGDTRKTGFLYPSFSLNSTDGFEANVPIYWNLAPNYDLQTDIKYMERRGVQLNSQFRYLTRYGNGDIRYEYLPEDALNTEYGERWGFQFAHSGIFANNWKVTADYSEVGDINYFTDLESDIGTRQDGQLVQEGSLSYRDASWDTTLLVRDFQLLIDDQSGSQPYRLMPQLSFNYYAPQLLPYLNFDLLSHISRFETGETDKPSATRLHVEPGLTIPIGATWGSWTNEARLLATYYQQDLTNVSSNDYEEEVFRTIPQVRSHLRVVLERDTTIFDGYTQTLEPQIQYLYVPERDQSAIYSEYDTTLLQTDYYGLFRSRRYSGVDYIARANQFSYGASTRFYDDDYKERLNISFGQILYLDNKTSSSSQQSNYSAWAVESDFNYDDHFFFHGGLQYDVNTEDMQVANATFEYQFNQGLVQTNYRYVSKQYIEDTVGETLSDLDLLTEKGIAQAGLVAQYSINQSWDASSQYYYDVTTDRTLEWQAGVSYKSDCWYIGFTYSRELTGWSPDFSLYPDADPEYENNFGINIGIIGFGTNSTIGSSLNSDSGALEYGRPFLLNN